MSETYKHAYDNWNEVDENWMIKKKSEPHGECTDYIAIVTI